MVLAALAGVQVAPVRQSGRWRDLGTVALAMRVVCTGCLKTDMELFWLKIGINALLWECSSLSRGKLFYKKP